MNSRNNGVSGFMEFGVQYIKRTMRMTKRLTLYVAVTVFVLTLYVLYSSTGRDSAPIPISTSLKDLLDIEIEDLRLPAKQDVVDYISKETVVTFRVVKNIEGECHGIIHIFNNGKLVIPNQNWSIYFYTVLLPEHTRFPYSPRGVLLGVSGMRIHHIAGSLYRISPDISRFSEIFPKSHLEIPIVIRSWVVSYSDIFPNWYVASPKAEARVIQNTENDEENFVEPFVREEQYKRLHHDRYSPYTSEERFSKAKVSRINGSFPQRVLLPSPFMTDIKNDSNDSIFVDNEHWTIGVQDEEFKEEALFLSEKSSIKVSPITPNASKIIIFAKENIEIPGASTDSLLEGYILEIGVTKDVITVKASTKVGAFYGAISIIMLNQKPLFRGSLRLPTGTIKDAPRYGYRGLMLDLGRNFMKKEEVLRIIDLMALYKMNKVHLHLSEDEGWRLEIPGLPRLTDFGSKRCHSENFFKSCLPPSLGSGPDSDTSGSGYYAVQDYKDILKYANRRHVTVIPEIDMPGHARAALKAMEAYDEYKLSDDDDSSRYLSVQTYTDNAVNPCLESTYKFIRHVMSAIKEMHENIQPLTLYHFGGDEVAKGAWVGSKMCKRLIGKDPDLKKYFVSRIAKIARDLELDLAAWEDGVMSDETNPYSRKLFKKDIYGYAWNNMWGFPSARRAYVLANNKYKVVLSHATHLYFDHAHEPDPEERGFYWAARYIDTFKTFGYMPDRFYDNADFKAFGEPTSRKHICLEHICDDLRKPENIVGMQAALWTETVRSPEQAQSMLFPRLLAVAERAWHKAPWESIKDMSLMQRKRNSDWASFSNFVSSREFKRLDALNIKYRIVPPGAIVRNNVLTAASVFPGLPIEYSIDEGVTWFPYIKPFDVSKYKSNTHDVIIHLRSRSHDGKRFSREVKVRV